MDNQYTVGSYLRDRLYELGLEHLFSIAGDYSIAWLNNYIEPSPINLIQEVNELNAGYAADAYARIKGIGALCVTYSAGALCAANPIAGAYAERVPVVLINGTPSIKKTLIFEQTGFTAHHFIANRASDMQVFEPITTAAIRLDNPGTAPMLIDYALTECITEQRPVYIELLQDMIDLPCAAPKDKIVVTRIASDDENIKNTINIFKERLANAEQPVIWVGVEVDRYGLHEQAEKLIKQLHIPYVTELLSKSVLSEDNAQFIGVFDGKASSGAVQSLLEKADFVLALGVWLTDINSLGWDIDYNKTAFASFDTIKFSTFFASQVYLADVVGGLLAANITTQPQELPQKETPILVSKNPSDKLDYQGFYDFIPRYIDNNTILGADASMNYFGSLLLKAGKPRGFIVQSSYSAIGYIGPAATGLSLAKKINQRVMVFTGDGGFQMSAQCLSTQTCFNLNPIIFVIDNGVYGVEQWLADASVYHDTTKPFFNSCLLHRWDYSKLAEVFQAPCKGWKAETYDELKTAIEGALANKGGPSVIQVIVPSHTVPTNALWKLQ
jgi:indolepyruvate decarboxylase